MGAGCCTYKDMKIQLRKSLLFDDSFSETDMLELSTPQDGKLIRWKRGRQISEGRDSQLFQCLSLNTGELLVVKSCKINFDSKKLQDFHKQKEEIALLKTLTHPNIVQYYQANLSPTLDTIDILIEYVAGDSLKNILSIYGSLSESVIVNYSFQILSGLDYLHSNGIPHKNLRPSNLLISNSGDLKLTGFETSQNTDKHAFWVAPEVLFNNTYELSTDIWAYACILIEMLTGTDSWNQASNDPKEVKDVICPYANNKQIPYCSASLREVIKLCLEKNPLQRPSAKQLLNHEFHSQCNSC